MPFVIATLLQLYQVRCIMSSLSKFFVSISVSIFMFVLCSEDAGAIPYFARKYDADCSMCHWHQPKLNSFGKKFQSNGYKISKDDNPDSFRSIDTLPLSIKIEPRIVLDNSVASSSDFQLHSIELLMGLTLSNGASVFVEKYLEERGDFHNAGDVYVNLPLGKRSHVKFGQFSTMNHIPDGERVTINRNIVYNSRVEIGGIKNKVRLRDIQRGLEIGTSLTDDTALSLSVFNGNSDAAEGGDDIADDNDYKSFNLQLIHDFVRSSVGAFYYGGDNAPAGSDSNRFYRAGITATWMPVYEWNIELITMAGRDKNLLNNSGLTRVDSKAFSLEVDHMIKDGFVLFGRYGDLRVEGTGFKDVKSTQFVGGFSFMVEQTQKMTLEFMNTTGNKDGEIQFEYEIAF